jgi:hypothetical protein
LTEHHCRHRRIGPADVENVPGGALVFLQLLVQRAQLGLDLGGEVLSRRELIETGPDGRKVGLNFVSQSLQKFFIYAVTRPGHIAEDPHMRGNDRVIDHHRRAAARQVGA